MLYDHLGRVWAFCNEGSILILSETSGKLLNEIRNKRLNFKNESKGLQFWAVFESKDHTIYMATSWGLRKIRNDSTEVHVILSNSPDPFYSKEIFACSMDDDEKLWFSDAENLFRLDEKQNRLEKILDLNHGVDSGQSTIYALFNGKEGDIWAGSQDGLAILLREKQPFSKYYQSFSSAVKIQHAFSLYQTNDSIMYCGASDGLYKVNLKSHLITEIDNGNACYMINRWSSKQLILSNSRGLFIVANDHLNRASYVYPWLRPIEHDLFCAAVHYNDSIIVFASQLQKGLYVCNLNRKEITTYNAGNSSLKLDNDVVNSLFLDEQGRLWVLSINTIFLFDPLNGSSTPYQIVLPLTKEKAGILFDMCETKSGYGITAYGKD